MWKKCWKTVVFKEDYLSVHMKHNSRLTFCLYFAISCTLHFSQESKKKIKPFNGNVKMTYLTFFISFFDGIFLEIWNLGHKLFKAILILAQISQFVHYCGWFSPISWIGFLLVLYLISCEKKFLAINHARYRFFVYLKY